MCLGSRIGIIIEVFNILENNYLEKFNKKIVYVSIWDEERIVEFKNDFVIFIIFDSFKGLERLICVIFDWLYEYYEWRFSRYNVNFIIIKNIFVVAVSCGKRKIIFYNEYDNLLNE